MYIFDIQGLLDNTATVYTKIEVLPKVAGESIITLTNEDSVKNWTYSDLRYVEKQGFIGQFVARTLDGELQNISDDFNIQDRTIVLYLGINSNHTSNLVTQLNESITDQRSEELITEQGENELTYYKLGTFFVEKPDDDQVIDSTKFQSQDYTMLFNATFNPNFTDSEYTKSFNGKLEDNETVTALWLAQYTCKQVGVELGTTTFRNSSFVIDSNQFDSDYTCRDVIKAIAKLAFTWARIGWDDKLYLDFNKATTVEDYNVITNDNYYSLVTLDDTYGEVNRILTGSSIVVGNSAYIEDAQSITNNGLTELDVYDNPILYTQELRTSAIANASPLLGLIYQPVEIETTGHPWLLGNELINVVDMEGNYLTTYAFDRVLTYNGHIRSKISTIAKTETESTYSYQGVENNEKEIKRSKVELDRQNQLLTSTMERTTTNESNISTMQQSITGISTNITSISGDITSLQGDVTTISGNLSSLSSDLTSLSGDVSTLSTDLNGLSVSFDDFYDNEYIQTIENLQDQIDGTIEFWTGNDIPTLNNAPANTWTTEALKQEHMGDVYIVLSGQAQGAEYRFVKDGNTWEWLEVSDSQIGAVRELAESAMAQATQNASDIIDLQATDVSLQASLDGISASVSTLQTNVDELDEGFDAITVAERTAIGNPVLIQDCGEYLIKNYTIYGNTSQNGTPTSTSPVNVNGVTGEHTVELSSKNVLDIENDTQISATVTFKSEDNIIYVNGTASSSSYEEFPNYITLTPGTYTMSYWVEGTTSNGRIPWIELRKKNTNTYMFSFSNTSTLTHNTQTVTISETNDYILRITMTKNVVYTDYKIMVQIEKSSTPTSYSNKYIEPYTYSYNLDELQLNGIGTYKDYIQYNLTDELWYLTKNIRKFEVNDHKVFGLANPSDTSDYIIITVYESEPDSSSNQYIEDMKSANNTIYCNKLPFRGSISSTSEIPQEEGLYVNFQSNLNNGSYVIYLSILKTTLGKQAGDNISSTYVSEWCSTANIVFYYVTSDSIIEPLTDNNLISDLDYIRNNAKLYDTHMIAQDTPSDNTTMTGDIGVNYLTNTIFNGIYASRSELKITQNSISTTVSETVNAVVENIDNRVTDVANTLEQNSKDLTNSINTLNNSLSDYAKQSSLITVTNTVENIQTSLNEQILVTQQIKQDGVDKVTTTTGFTFDKDGLTIDKTGADTKTVIDEDGMTVYSTTGSEQSELLNVDSQGVQTENIYVRTYTQIGSHTRLQDYEDGTAIFYIE